MEVPKKLKMIFQIQKNRQNGQSITLVANDAHQDICPVWAAGMSPAFMTSQLLWMGDSYMLYLRNTSILQHKHINALNIESDELMKLFGINKDVLPNVVPVDNNMGDN